MRRALAAVVTLLALALAGPALAHRVNVFASVDGDEVLVEVKFSTGRIPVSGDVVVAGADGEVLATYELASDGTLRFPLDREAAAEGLEITVTTGDDHEGYWLLTPADIAAGDAEAPGDGA
ncbi:MAG: hypothetical protein ACU0BF_09775 [Paracoccaceae bacterium]